MFLIDEIALSSKSVVVLKFDLLKSPLLSSAMTRPALLRSERVSYFGSRDLTFIRRHNVQSRREEYKALSNNCDKLSKYSRGESYYRSGRPTAHHGCACLDPSRFQACGIYSIMDNTIEQILVWRTLFWSHEKYRVLEIVAQVQGIGVKVITAYVSWERSPKLQVRLANHIIAFHLIFWKHFQELVQV